MFHQAFTLFCTDIFLHCLTRLIRGLLIRNLNDLQFTVTAQPLAVFGDGVS